MRKLLQGCGDVKIHSLTAGYKSQTPEHEKTGLDRLQLSLILSYCRSTRIKKEPLLKKSGVQDCFNGVFLQPDGSPLSIIKNYLLLLDKGSGACTKVWIDHIPRSTCGREVDIDD